MLNNLSKHTQDYKGAMGTQFSEVKRNILKGKTNNPPFDIRNKHKYRRQEFSWQEVLASRSRKEEIIQVNFIQREQLISEEELREILYSEILCSEFLYEKKERLKELIFTHNRRRTAPLSHSLSIPSHRDDPRETPLTGRGVLMKKK